MREPQIIYEQPELLGISKPARRLVHAAGTKAAPADGTLVDWLLPRYPEIRRVGDDPASRPGIVHRLDKDTSGVMLVARTQEDFLFLKYLFSGRQMATT